MLERVSLTKVKLNGIWKAYTFRYINIWIMSDERCIKEIKSRIKQAKTAFYNMKNSQYNKSLSFVVSKKNTCMLHRTHFNNWL